MISYILTVLFYYPFIILNFIFQKLKVDTSNIPLNYYYGMNFKRIAQDCYDRFFTNIEHRYSIEQIQKIFTKYYKHILFSKKQPYWHFYVRN